MIKTTYNGTSIKRGIILSCISIVLSFVVLNIFHIKQLNNMYKQNIYIQQHMVGSLIQHYPNEEDKIINCLKNKNEKIQTIGQNILNKYGYNIDDSIIKYDMYKDTITKSISIFLIISITLVVINFICVSNIIYKIINVLRSISNKLDQLSKKNYFIEEDFSDRGEGIVSLISSQIADLGKQLNLNFNNLNNEKESLKALVTDISHQLKTPIASLKLYNSILMNNDIKQEESKLFFIKNEETINKLHNLIDALVNISRLEASMINMKIENKNIKDTIIKAINSTYIKALDKNIEISMDETEDIYVEHDEKWTEEAIFNVIENSIKYTPEDGNIDIHLSQSINYIKIEIEDNGIGIKKENYNEIFKRFYRGSNDEVKATEGSGVGLYLSRKIIEDQGGNITVESVLGKGSKFSVLLQKCKDKR